MSRGKIYTTLLDLKNDYEIIPVGKAINIIGKKYGYLLVLERVKYKRKNEHTYWACMCDCGNYIVVDGTHLKTSHTTSCGCQHSSAAANVLKEVRRLDKANGNVLIARISRKRAEDLRIKLEGQRFGSLAVGQFYPKGSIPEAESHGVYSCECDCGNIRYHDFYELTRGVVKSCGCQSHKSNVEILIESLLNALDIQFEREVWFDNLKSKNGHRLYFDFGINNNQLLLEYQGEQHYMEVPYWDSGSEGLAIRQDRDQRKRDYCKKHNINLIEIPYWDKTKLNCEYLKQLLMENGYEK